MLTTISVGIIGLEKADKPSSAPYLEGTTTFPEDTKHFKSPWWGYAATNPSQNWQKSLLVLKWCLALELPKTKKNTVEYLLPHSQWAKWEGDK